MYKKTILSIAIASTLTLTGCLENDEVETKNIGANTNPITESDVAGTYPIFAPAESKLPFTPNDLLIQQDDADTLVAIEQSDGSYAIPGSSDAGASPPVIAYENLSGMSLTASIDIELSGALSTDAGNVNGTSFIIAGSAPVPNPNQNVFLLELDYASESPLTALARQEPPTLPLALTAAAAAGGDAGAGATLAGLATAPDYDAEYITRTKSDGSTGYYIRINPLKPLNPGKRYVVVVTNEIVDADGQQLTRSPGVAGYDTLSNLQQGLADPALAPVKALINNLWETVGTNYFAVTNQARPAGSPLGESNIVVSMSFTTSLDTNVVDYMIEPNRWITDTVESVVRQTAATAAVQAGASDYDTVKATVDAAYNGWLPSTFNAALAGCDAAPAGAARFSCVGSNAVGLVDGLTANGLPTPEADTSITFTGQRDLRAVSALITDAIALPGTVNVSEGLMGVPYYSGVPTTRGVSDGSEINLVNEWWKADQDLATGISAAFGLSVPQADTTGTDNVQSDVVNAFFPFPRRNSIEEIPVLAIYPADDTNKPAGGYKTIIFQHGITTDRSTALTLGSAIVANSGGTVAVVAIDQPIHGVDHLTDTDKAIWAEIFLAGSGTLTTVDGTNDGVDADEQAVIDSVVDGSFTVGVLLQIQGMGCPLGITDPTDAGQIGAAITAVSGGACGGAAATSLASAQLLVSTVANGASQIPGLARTANERHFDFGGVNLVPTPIDYTDPNATVGVSSAGTGSGSMTINIGNFLTSRDNFRQQILDLMTLRLSIPTMDLDGDTVADLDTSNVHFIGHSLGTLNGIPFVEIANDTATTADDIVTANFLTPGGNIARLAENSPVFAPRILLGLISAANIERGDADLEAFVNALQAALDSFDPINFVGNLNSTTSTTKALFTEVVGDTFIPNNADPTAVDITNPFTMLSFGPGTRAPLAGTDPLETISGATAINATGALGINFVRFTEASGMLHTTPAVAATAAEVPSFAEIIGQATSMVVTDGANIVVGDDTLLVAP